MDIEIPRGKKTLKVIQLVMINVIAVDSIRTLSFSAVYGYSTLFFYLLAALVFFIPTALVSAELGTGWPNRGGIYVWVREAFGKRLSFVVIWLNWIYNIIWYPTIMALIAGTAAYFFNPDLASNRLYMCLSTITLFWLSTWVNCLGMRASGWLSMVGALIGTIMPMLLIAILGLSWVLSGHPAQIQMGWSQLLPSGVHTENLAFLTNVFFGLLGLEMAATHAAEMQNPKRDYPRSLLAAVIIILATIVPGSLAIAVVVPSSELSLATGVMQAFQIFSNYFGMPWLFPCMAGAIVLGGVSAVGAWIIGPTKGLLVASQDGSLSKRYTQVNEKGVPVRILCAQAVVVSLLCLVFILMPTVNNAYWIFSVITAQLALVVYVILFATALKLHYHKPHVVRSFRIPGKRWGIWSVCSLGIGSCVAVILAGFLPPAQVPFHNVFLYELILGGGIALCLVIPFYTQKTLKARR